MIYRVFHDLGPNKGSIKKIKPFGTDGGIVGGEESKVISEVGNLEINYKVNQNESLGRKKSAFRRKGGIRILFQWASFFIL